MRLKSIFFARSNGLALCSCIAFFLSGFTEAYCQNISQKTETEDLAATNNRYFNFLFETIFDKFQKNVKIEDLERALNVKFLDEGTNVEQPGNIVVHNYDYGWRKPNYGFSIFFNATETENSTQSLLNVALGQYDSYPPAECVTVAELQEDARKSGWQNFLEVGDFINSGFRANKGESELVVMSSIYQKRGPDGQWSKLYSCAETIHMNSIQDN